MRHNTHNQKLTQIIHLSNSYRLHLTNLYTIKPAIETRSRKRIYSLEQLIHEKKKYKQAAKNHSVGIVAQENNRLLKRLNKISDGEKRKFSSQMSISKRIDNEEERKYSEYPKCNLSRKRLNSVSSSRSLNSIISNSRDRTLKQKQIQRYNIKLAERIANPRTVRQYALSELKKSYEKEQEVVRTRSRFSDKNQYILRSFALHGLKVEKRHLQYLPQIFTSRKQYARFFDIDQEKSIAK